MNFIETSRINLEMFPPSPEPVFNLINTSNYIFSTAKTREEAIDQLLRTNVEWVKFRCSDRSYVPYESLTHEVIFEFERACAALSLSDAIKSLAIEFFDRFHIPHLRNVLGEVEDQIVDLTSMGGKRRVSERILKRAQKQIPLRVLTVLQLASKVISRDQCLTSKKIREYLTRRANSKECPVFGYQDILNSELRVLKALDHKLMLVSRFEALETLLGLRRCPQLLILAPQLFSVARQMLQLLYLKHRTIFDQVYSYLCINTRRRVKSKPFLGSEIQQAEVDNVWAGASLLIAAVSLVDPGLQEVVIEELLEDLDNLRSDNELRTLAFVIAQHFQGEGPVCKQGLVKIV